MTSRESTFFYHKNPGFRHQEISYFVYPNHELMRSLIPKRESIWNARKKLPAALNLIQILSTEHIRQTIKIIYYKRIIPIDKFPVRSVINDESIMESLLGLLHNIAVTKKITFLFMEVRDTPSLSIEEQMQVFAEANIIVGCHGAGFANVIFSKEAYLIEFMHPWRPQLCYNETVHATHITSQDTISPGSILLRYREIYEMMSSMTQYEPSLGSKLLAPNSMLSTTVYTVIFGNPVEYAKTIDGKRLSTNDREAVKEKVLEELEMTMVDTRPNPVGFNFTIQFSQVKEAIEKVIDVRTKSCHTKTMHYSSCDKF